MGLVMASISKWFAESYEGNTWLGNLMKLMVIKGDTSKKYEKQVDYRTGARIEYKPQDIQILLGATYQGAPINYSELIISEREGDICSICGATTHCTKLVFNPAYDHYHANPSDVSQVLCNHCITYHEHPRVKDQGNYDICVKCTKKKCPHHPSRKVLTLVTGEHR
jgi:hypothetical protein